MDIKVTGDPGQGNSYNETTLQHVDSFNPAATTVNNNHYYSSNSSSRMAADFERLRQEILKGVRQETIEDLKYYITKLPGTRSAEEKLSDGGFKKSSIRDALRLKELYARRATMYQDYPSAQQINLDLFTRIRHEFEDTIFPIIESGAELSVVMQQIRTKIVIPIMQLLNENGASDEHLHYSEDHIYGMIYYLTGMCHLNWKDYDNDNL